MLPQTGADRGDPCSAHDISTRPYVGASPPLLRCSLGGFSTRDDHLSGGTKIQTFVLAAQLSENDHARRPKQPRPFLLFVKLLDYGHGLIK